MDLWETSRLQMTNYFFQGGHIHKLKLVKYSRAWVRAGGVG